MDFFEISFDEAFISGDGFKYSNYIPCKLAKEQEKIDKQWGCEGKPVEASTSVSAKNQQVIAPAAVNNKGIFKKFSK